jgi:hypothetical protein
MERDLIPRLEKDVPNQPSQQQLEDDPSLHAPVLLQHEKGLSDNIEGPTIRGYRVPEGAPRPMVANYAIGRVER